MPKEIQISKETRVDIDGEISIVIPKGFCYQIYGSKSEATGGIRPFLFFKKQENEYFLSKDIDTDYPFCMPELFLISNKIFMSVTSNDKEVEILNTPENIKNYNGIIDKIHEIRVNSPMASMLGDDIVKPELVLKSKDILIYSDCFNNEDSNFEFTMFTSRFMYSGQIWINDTESKTEIDSIVNKWFKSIKLSRKKDPFKPALEYQFDLTAKIDENTVIPIPDGYKYSDNSKTLQNKDWNIIVPDEYSLNEDHIDAKPFSIAIGKLANPAESFIADDDIIDRLVSLLKFQAPGMFDDSLQLNRKVISKHCALLYQANLDMETYKWCKIKGIIISCESMYQFHAYENFEDEVAYRSDIQDDFKSEFENWADGIVCLKDGKKTKSGSRSTSKKTDKLTFTSIDADESLYERYASRVQLRGFRGVVVINNDTGADYSLISLASIDDDIYKKIAARDKSSYTLDKLADKFKGVFRVDKSVFNSAHDRECEIAEGIMHKDHNLVALRSFAWTLTECCNRYNISPSDITFDNLASLIDFISERKWLNFDDSLCKGLCSGRDLHVIYIPDNTTKAEKSAILPSEEDYENLRRMQEKFPSYNGGYLAQTASIDELRKDLEYISPAIETLWNSLCSNRNTKEELEGDIADVVYAFCAMAKAAKCPFFTEDGPTNCDFSRMTDKVVLECNTSNIKSSAKTKSTVNNSDNNESNDINNGISITEAEAKKSWYFRKLKDGYSILGYKGDCTDVEVPSYIEGIPVTSMGYKENGYEEVKNIVVPDTVTFLKDKAFKNATNLESVTLPSSLNRMGCNVFESCYDLQKVNIPEGIKELNSYTFGYCRRLKTIQLPESINKIEWDVFSYCSSLEDINIKNNPRYVYKNGCLIDTEFRCLFFSNNGNSIPNDGSVHEIWYAFSGRKELESVNIPSTVRKIGEDAFSGCEGLREVIIPKGVTDILDRAFAYCTGLTKIIIPKGVTEIGFGAFQYCSGLKEIIIPEGVTKIGPFAFDDCTELKEIKIPEGVTEIGINAFDNCSGLKEIIIPEGVKEIGFYAFQNCTGLRNVTIPKSVKKIECNSFSGCSELTEVSLSENITEIEENAFDKCNKLTTIIMSGEPNKTIKEYFDRENIDVKFCIQNKQSDKVSPSVVKVKKDVEKEASYTKIETVPSTPTTTSPLAKNQVSPSVVKVKKDIKKEAIYSKIETVPSTPATTAPLAKNQVSPSVVKVKKDVEKEAIYIYAVELLSFAESESDYRNVIKELSQIKGYKDSDIKIRECQKKLNEIANEKKYKSVSSRTKTSQIKTAQIQSSKPKEKGCYVATSVYGSYNCPQVWTLRRFRDFKLNLSWFGRTFITIYYAVSPTIVKHFGNTEWFNKMWRCVLDRMVESLQTRGYEDTPYEDGD